MCCPEVTNTHMLNLGIKAERGSMYTEVCIFWCHCVGVCENVCNFFVRAFALTPARCLVYVPSSILCSLLFLCFPLFLCRMRCVTDAGSLLSFRFQNSWQLYSTRAIHHTAKFIFMSLNGLYLLHSGCTLLIVWNQRTHDLLLFPVRSKPSRKTEPALISNSAAAGMVRVAKHAY